MLNAKQKLLLHKLRIYGPEKLSVLWDIPLFFMRIPAVRRTTAAKTIVFVGEHLATRVPRMAKWIRRESDYSTVLVCHERGFIAEFTNDCFDHTFLFRNKWHMMRILRSIEGIKIVQGFAPKSAFVNHARKFIRKPYVQDMQDAYTIYYKDKALPKWLEKELPYEYACITEADGIVAASLEMNQVLKMDRSLKRPETLFFPLYCDDDYLQPMKTEPLDPDDIHIVYAGAVSGSHRNSKLNGNTQFFQLIELLSRQKLHFHMYASPISIRLDYQEYEQLAVNNPYFHFHPAVHQDILAQEMSRYHFGILPFFSSLSDLSGLKLKYATSLKLFNYFEAGLPVIISKDIVYQHWMVDRHHCGIDLEQDSMDKLREQILASDYESLIREVEKTRRKLSLKKQMPRLIAFYDKL